MNKQTEALKMAIEALEDANNVVFQEWSIEGEYNDAIKVCREALEQPACKHGVDDGCCKECYMEQTQPAQEPVACKVMAIDFDTEDGYTAFISLSNPIEIGTELYTHPAPSWQGLSDDERHEVIVKHVAVDCTCDPYEFSRAIEQALKEKNNG